MADWKNLTPEAAAAYAVACNTAPHYVGQDDEFEFEHDDTDLLPGDANGAVTIVTDADSGLAYRVTCIAERFPDGDR